MTPNQPGYEGTMNDIRDFRGGSQDAIEAAKRLGFRNVFIQER